LGQVLGGESASALGALRGDVNDQVYIGLGSNQGDREHYLFQAVQALGRIDAVGVLERSSLYESAPVGPPQPRYLNAVVRVDCGLQPRQLLAILKQIELDLGRERPSSSTSKWGPRAIDLDILLWGAEVVADPNLQIPHLELHKRRFALEPLSELAPNARHPLMGQSVQDILRGLPGQDVVRLDAPDWAGVASEREE
jgi:2-amino-4-hydroxy-6-hydroxymethyldihydropteridine diphosphokinase